MKRIYFSLAFAFCQWALCLAHPVSFCISDGIDNLVIKSKM